MNDLPVNERFVLTIREASKYFGIGEKTLRRIAYENANSGLIIKVGNRLLIKRKQFEQYIDNTNEL